MQHISYILTELTGKREHTVIDPVFLEYLAKPTKQCSTEIIIKFSVQITNVKSRNDRCHTSKILFCFDHQ